MKTPRHRGHWLAILPVLLFPLLAGASDADDVMKLMQRGAHKEALALADREIAKKPQDANLRFLKGVVLAQMERKPEAVVVFTALTKEFPKLAEPYNNLGVLLAGSGDYERARESLQQAIQVAPGYAIAHENLGDLYARLSTAAYEKAAQLDAGNAKTRSKLTLARNLSSAVTGATAVAAATSPPTSKPAPGAVAAAAKPVASVVAANLAPVAVSAAAKPVASVPPANLPRVAAQPVAAGGDQTAVLDAVTRWAGAWSARDLAGYLASYSPDFTPPGGMSIAAWQAERKSRIAGKREIKVLVQQPMVRIEGNQATVKFIQSYSSGQLKSSDVKELVLTRQGERWLIRQEQVKS
ncbi:nuclear transport factor 2 family protein [Lacisediminimonas profundi]|uniref:nuclear transport factor 2 family protein n=1 Tax=Lacisediminimonas profundi TaxID=2603856 RepID=UPI001386A5F4|nr:tetratricopeptide repeat protein [Lacisediminimonas profundi]